MNDDRSTVEQRLSAVETDLANVKQSVDAMGLRLDAGFASLREQQVRNQQTPWSTLGTWASVVLAVVGMVGALAILPLRESVLEARSDLKALMPIDEKFNALAADYGESKEDLYQTDARLQREMRDLDATIVAEMQAGDRRLDSILQREMALGVQVRDAKLDAVLDRVKAVELTIGVRPIVERLDALEK